MKTLHQLMADLDLDLDLLNRQSKSNGSAALLMRFHEPANVDVKSLSMRYAYNGFDMDWLDIEARCAALFLSNSKALDTETSTEGYWWYYG